MIATAGGTSSSVSASKIRPFSLSTTATAAPRKQAKAAAADNATKEQPLFSSSSESCDRNRARLMVQQVEAIEESNARFRRASKALVDTAPAPASSPVPTANTNHLPGTSNMISSSTLPQHDHHHHRYEHQSATAVTSTAVTARIGTAAATATAAVRPIVPPAELMASSSASSQRRIPFTPSLLDDSSTVTSQMSEGEGSSIMSTPNNNDCNRSPPPPSSSSPTPTQSSAGLGSAAAAAPATTPPRNGSTHHAATATKTNANMSSPFPNTTAAARNHPQTTTSSVLPPAAAVNHAGVGTTSASGDSSSTTALQPTTPLEHDLKQQLDVANQTVQDCLQALMSVKENASLKERKMELEIHYLRGCLNDANAKISRLKIMNHSLHKIAKTATDNLRNFKNKYNMNKRGTATEPATTTSLSVTGKTSSSSTTKEGNEQAKQEKKEDSKQTTSDQEEDDDEDYEEKLKELREKEIETDKEVQKLMQAHRQANEESYYLKKLLVKTCDKCRARLPIRSNPLREQAMNSDNNSVISNTSSVTMSPRGANGGRRPSLTMQQQQQQQQQQQTNGVPGRPNYQNAAARLVEQMREQDRQLRMGNGGPPGAPNASPGPSQLQPQSSWRKNPPPTGTAAPRRSCLKGNGMGSSRSIDPLGMGSSHSVSSSSFASFSVSDLDNMSMRSSMSSSVNLNNNTSGPVIVGHPNQLLGPHGPPPTTQRGRCDRRMSGSSVTSATSSTSGASSSVCKIGHDGKKIYPKEGKYGDVPPGTKAFRASSQERDPSGVEEQGPSPQSQQQQPVIQYLSNDDGSVSGSIAGGSSHGNAGATGVRFGTVSVVTLEPTSAAVPASVRRKEAVMNAMARAKRKEEIAARKAETAALMAAAKKEKEEQEAAAAAASVKSGGDSISSSSQHNGSSRGGWTKKLFKNVSVPVLGVVGGGGSQKNDAENERQAKSADSEEDAAALGEF